MRKSALGPAGKVLGELLTSEKIILDKESRRPVRTDWAQESSLFMTDKCRVRKAHHCQQSRPALKNTSLNITLNIGNQMEQNPVINTFWDLRYLGGKYSHDWRQAKKVQLFHKDRKKVSPMLCLKSFIVKTIWMWGWTLPTTAAVWLCRQPSHHNYSHRNESNWKAGAKRLSRFLNSLQIS